MTTLIFDWSELLGRDASGSVRVRATRWRKEPETLGVPWFRDQRFTGRATMDVDPGLVLELTWTPSGQRGSLHQTIVVPAEGEHLAHLLAVDPDTLDPLTGDDLVTAADLMARAEALTARIESGEFTGAAGADGADGVSVESITDDDGDGVATVRLSSGVESPLPLPRGPQGERGERGLTGEQGDKGQKGDTGPAPDVSWAGDRLTVGGQTGPSLTGPQGVKGDRGPRGEKGDKGDRGDQGDRGDTGATGPATTLTIGTVQSGTSADATLTGEAPAQTLSLVLPKGDTGDRGPQGDQGPPGVVATAADYLIVGPGRPDTPATTAGTITGAEPVGAEYRSTDGAGVGAWTWRKRPSGWVVTDGDTGWRFVQDVLTWDPLWENGNSVLIRRCNDTVTWEFTSDAPPANPPGEPHFMADAYLVGDEWLPFQSVYLKLGQDLADGEGCGLWLQNGGLIVVVEFANPANVLRGQMSFPARDRSWPTTLPGSPA